MDILTQQDTYFGATAYRDKLVTKEQLSEAVTALAENPGMRLGEMMVRKGFLTQEQVEAILSIQRRQHEILDQRTPPPPPVSPPLPAPPAAVSVAAGTRSAETPEPSADEAPPAMPTVSPTPAAQTASVAVPAQLGHLADYLAYAQASGASDLHMSAGVRPFLRVAGRIEPIQVPPLPPEETERMLLEVLSETQKTALLDKLGLEFSLVIPDVGRCRACIVKQRVGWDGTFHLTRNGIPSFEELGLPECLRRLTDYQQGMVLVTGPGNSGKSTTLAALIDVINASRDDHIITVESPVEYVHPPKKCQVTQRQVGLHTKSFSTALRAALREDPDIIMIGELRDLETLSMSISAAETGHLVFGTLHTTSAARTIGRVLDAFPPSQQGQIRMMISESLRGVVSQQLIPRKDGRGAALALEILFVTAAIAALIRDNKPFQIPSVVQTSRKIGMCLMDDSLMALVNQGVITGAEAHRRAENKRAFEGVKGNA